MKMIGILGGTFDPVHFGHLTLAQFVYDHLACNEIRLLPCHQPAHRAQPIASPTQRVEMLSLAIQDIPYFKIDLHEINRETPSYMVDTLHAIRKESPQNSLLLIMGFDAFANLDHWHQWKKLLAYAHIVVVTRPDSQATLNPTMQQFLPEHKTFDLAVLEQFPAGKIYQLEMPPIKISGTTIRKLLAKKELPNNAIPDSVMHYIQEHHLYGVTK